MSGDIVPILNGEIHVLMVDDREVKEQLLLHKYSEWLTDKESAQWQRFYFAKDRHQYLVTRALIRYALSRFMKPIYEAEWKFVTNKYGRPAIANMFEDNTVLQFNISHTRGLIVLALSVEGELGIDVEHLVRSGQTVELADHFFSASEVAQLHSLPISQQQHRFFDFWTLKESYIKARGMGLSIPLNSFSFSFPDKESIELKMEATGDDLAEGWKFWQLSPNSTHKIALAYRNNNVNVPIKIRVWRALPAHSITQAVVDIFRSSD